MKNRASALLKKIIPVLSSMAKAKTMALKSKTSIIKARLIVFSLLRNKKLLVTSISQKFHSLLGEQSLANEETLVDPEDQSKAMVLYNHANTYDTHPIHTQSIEEKEKNEGNDYDYDYDYDDDDKYPDLTHSLFDSEDLDLEGSVIDLVKNSKEEAGQDFNLEDDIDHVADLFIRKFHKQMMVQKLNSFKYKEMRHGSA